MREKWTNRHQGQCRRMAGGAPGAQQKLSAVQERPTEKQAVLLQPMGTTWSTSLHAAQSATVDVS